ncbi:LLM class F420-dependent oxidoreductase [Gordonia aurantiaca]|uniref:LLM class F420-dependent oxidoreductase n=1 Tax=Gordonia sp. B21 TaxID=3151852 RepID=UPI0032638201
MQLRVFTEPQQGATYDQLLAVAKAAEDLGYDAFFRSDHYTGMNTDGLPGPTDAWITLAGLARETSRIRLGTLVSSATFRLPGPFAISVANVDQMSGGRIELGLGAGWFEAEHTGYGIPFPPVKERFDRLEETFEIITGLWATPEGETFDHQGEHWQLTDSPALPKPVQKPRPPIIVGGNGKKRTPAIAARFADEFNIVFQPVETARELIGRVNAACVAAGRRPETMTYSAALVLCCGRDEAEFRRRAEAIRREPDELRENGAAGTPDEVVAKIATYRELGIERIYLQTLDLDDLDHLELVSSKVAPQLR